MNAILLSCILCYTTLLVGFLLPAMFLHWQLLQVSEPQSRSDYVLQCLGIGSLYAATQFILLYAIESVVDSRITLLAIKFGIDFGFSGFWLHSYRSQFAINLRWLSPNKWRTTSILQLVLGLAFGFISLFWVPFALDNSAIIWVINSLEIENFPIQNSQGAIAYIALLYFPSAIVDGIVPVTTSAATLKVFLSLLLALVAQKIASAIGELLALERKSIGYHSLALQMILLTTALAKYGVFDTGKETVFSILFLFAFAANLISLRNSEFQFWIASLPLAAAIGFGAISVPYAITLVSIFAVLSLDRINIWRFGFVCTAVCSIPLWVSFHAMLDWSWFKSAMPLMLCCGTLAILDQRVEFRSLLPKKLPFFLLAISIIGVFLLMPVSFHQGRYPLDGTTTALDLFIHKNKFFAPGLLGAVACLIYLQRGNLKRNEGMFAFLLFPWCAMLAVLIVVHSGTHDMIGLHPQNVWDWAKDVPRWLSGLYIGALAIFAWHELSRLINNKKLHSSKRVKWWNAKTLMAFGLVLLFVLNIRTVAKRMEDLGQPAYTKIGGSYDRSAAEFLTWAYLARKSKNLFTSEMDPIIVSEDSLMQNREYIFKMYGVHCRTENSLPEHPRPNRRLWFVCRTDNLSEFSSHVKDPDAFVIKNILDMGTESVYSLTPRHVRTKTANNEITPLRFK